jgi:hypothetical protein
MKNTRLSFMLFAIVLLLYSCKKETRYVYTVQQQELYETSAEKRNEKTTLQFITIAYSDLFNSNITNNELNKLDIAYQAFGDRKVLGDLIVKNLLERSGALLPTNNAMRADIPEFVNGAYLRFFNRKPTEFEAWKMKDLIEKNVDITAKMVYYSLMTSEEYRYY